jgi:peptidoglycan biosynthesis protein MviN/MurJ (putative lipid II flippase)
LVAVDGVISALLAAFFLAIRIGPVPLPVSALISGLLNAALVWVALQWTSSPRLAALPLWTWLATVVALTLPGPGNDAVYAAQWQLLLLIIVGAVPPLMLLYRRNHPR